MQGDVMLIGQVMYLGRYVPKEGFRAFIYHADGKKKCVESWNDYQKHIESGCWFSTSKDAKKAAEASKELDDLIESEPVEPVREPKKRRAPVKKEALIADVDEHKEAFKSQEDSMGFEVKPGDDGFLSEAV